MNSHRRFGMCISAIALAAFAFSSGALAQEKPAAPDAKPAAAAPPTRRGPQGPVVVSPEVAADRQITFRILAPKAEKVSLNGGDIPAGGPRELTKGEKDVWTLKIGPIDPGTYRYTFTVDGVSVIDPRNSANSESNNNVWSVVHVPGSGYMDANDVPHGAVATVYYHSSTLSRTRRMHIYTPPGYENSQEKYPVFYLLHGASDSDDSWTSVGRANFILDNLIAAKKAKPMIVVMPAGHTSSAPFQRPAEGARPTVSEFDNDFVKDIMPYVESHYRVMPGRENRALAGLSMGGGQTLSIGLAHPQDFAYLGVYSSGIFSRDLAAWEKDHVAELDNSAKDGLKLFWLKTGKEDFLVQTSRNTVELLKKHGFKPLYEENSGGHTWINWHIYLNEFAPMLFQ